MLSHGAAKFATKVISPGISLQAWAKGDGELATSRFRDCVRETDSVYLRRHNLHVINAKKKRTKPLASRQILAYRGCALR